MTEPIPAVDAEQARARYGPLTQSVRRLIDATIRSEADDADVAHAHRLIDEAVELLSSRLNPKPFGVRQDTDGRPLPWGNVAIGLRNAVAPPLQVHSGDGRSWVEVTMGAPYEGPPGQVHGGICALLLDHVLGATAHRSGAPAVTGTLTIRYLRPTWLGRLRVEAWIDREQDSKTFAAGHITDTEGVVTVQAEGVFLRPR
ncbi:PaaI family thioesterase [Mycolicibacterium thermoresistibile]